MQKRGAGDDANIKNVPYQLLSTTALVSNKGQKMTNLVSTHLPIVQNPISHPQIIVNSCQV